jgi:hypothetical protein
LYPCQSKTEKDIILFHLYFNIEELALFLENINLDVLEGG